MDITLLTKLVKLANNNSNENEANLAARKVCRMIESANFKFADTPPIPPNNSIPPSNTAYAAWQQARTPNYDNFDTRELDELIERMFGFRRPK